MSSVGSRFRWHIFSTDRFCKLGSSNRLGSQLAGCFPEDSTDQGNRHILLLIFLGMCNPDHMALDRLIPRYRKTLLDNPSTQFCRQ